MTQWLVVWLSVVTINQGLALWNDRNARKFMGIQLVINKEQVKRVRVLEQELSRLKEVEG